jgi:hypothetical protein
MLKNYYYEYHIGIEVTILFINMNYRNGQTAHNRPVYASPPVDGPGCGALDAIASETYFINILTKYNNLDNIRWRGGNNAEKS